MLATDLLEIFNIRISGSNKPRILSYAKGLVSSLKSEVGSHHLFMFIPNNTAQAAYERPLSAVYLFIQHIIRQLTTNYIPCHK